MHLPLPFVITAFLAWQAAAGSLYGKADISHDRVGVAHRMLLRARGAIPEEPVADLLQEPEAADPEVDNLMARIKGSTRPLNVVAFRGSMVAVDGTEPTQPAEVDGTAQTNQTDEAPVEPAAEEPESGTDAPDSAALVDTEDIGDSDAATAFKRRQVQAAPGKKAKLRTKKAVKATPSLAPAAANKQKATPKASAPQAPAVKAVSSPPAVEKPLSTPPAAVKPVSTPPAVVKAVSTPPAVEAPAESSPDAPPKPKYTKPAAPSGFTGVDLFGGRTPTFVPNPPTFGAKPPFKKRDGGAEAEAVPMPAASGAIPSEPAAEPAADAAQEAKVQLVDAIEHYLTETNTTLQALATTLEQVASGSQNATVALNSNPLQPIVGAVDLTGSDDLNNQEGEIIERPPPVALNPVGESKPVAPEQPAAEQPAVEQPAAASDPVNLLKPTPTFVPDPPKFEKRVKRRVV